MEAHLAAQGERATLQLQDIGLFKVNKSKGKFIPRPTTKPSHLTNVPPSLKLDSSFLRHANDAVKESTDQPTCTPREEPKGTNQTELPASSFVGAMLPTVNRMAEGEKVVAGAKPNARTKRNQAPPANVAHYKLIQDECSAKSPTISITQVPKQTNSNRTRRDEGAHFSNVVQGSRPPSRSAIPSNTRTRSRQETTPPPSNQDHEHLLHRKSSMNDLELVHSLDVLSSKAVFRTRHDPTMARDFQDVTDFQVDFGSWEGVDAMALPECSRQ